MSKLVSILLPTYNGAKRIKDSIESILGQSHTLLELIVVDDGSDDDTKKVIEELVKIDQRIRYIRNEKNLGIQKSLNRGLNESKGEYVARIDDDDLWIEKDKLKDQIEFLERNKDYVLVGTGFIAVNENGEEIFRQINPILDQDIRSKILSKNCFVHSGVVFRKDIALECGGYSESEEIKHIEDYDLWLKLGNIGKLANLATYSVRLILREGSISSKNKISQLKQSIKIIKKFRDKYPNHTKAVISLSMRLFVYRVFQMTPLRYLSNKMYKLYKNI